MVPTLPPMVAVQPEKVTVPKSAMVLGWLLTIGVSTYHSADNIDELYVKLLWNDLLLVTSWTSMDQVFAAESSRDIDAMILSPGDTVNESIVTESLGNSSYQAEYCALWR